MSCRAAAPGRALRVVADIGSLTAEAFEAPVYMDDDGAGADRCFIGQCDVQLPEGCERDRLCLRRPTLIDQGFSPGLDEFGSRDG